ncbi:MAG TPA: hypothetical protein ENN43_00680 [bacterium]|nr:hypothetical protein [bacterium]
MDWKKIREDIRGVMKEGMAKLKEGAEIAGKKAGELTEEGKRRLKINEIKTNIHNETADLGARIYELEKEAPGTITDVMVAQHVEKIKKLAEELEALEKNK